jgi:hypothetical protein
LGFVKERNESTTPGPELTFNQMVNSNPGHPSFKRMGNFSHDNLAIAGFTKQLLNLTS